MLLCCWAGCCPKFAKLKFRISVTVCSAPVQVGVQGPSLYVCTVLTSRTKTLYTGRLAIPLFTCFFSGQGKFENILVGCDSIEHRGKRLEQGPWLACWQSYSWMAGTWFVRCWNLKKACHTHGISRDAIAYSITCSCSYKAIVPYMMSLKYSMASRSRTLFREQPSAIAK